MREQYGSDAVSSDEQMNFLTLQNLFDPSKMVPIMKFMGHGTGFKSHAVEQIARQQITSPDPIQI